MLGETSRKLYTHTLPVCLPTRTHIPIQIFAHTTLRTPTTTHRHACTQSHILAVKGGNERSSRTYVHAHLNASWKMSITKNHRSLSLSFPLSFSHHPVLLSFPLLSSPLLSSPLLSSPLPFSLGSFGLLARSLARSRSRGHPLFIFFQTCSSLFSSTFLCLLLVSARFCSFLPVFSRSTSSFREKYFIVDRRFSSFDKERKKNRRKNEDHANRALNPRKSFPQLREGSFHGRFRCECKRTKKDEKSREGEDVTRSTGWSSRGRAISSVAHRSSFNFKREKGRENRCDTVNEHGYCVGAKNFFPTLER